jgi:hydrogenase nickel incorporation protein HypA/HybF
MHELSVTQNIVAIVGEAAKGRRVTRVTLEIGKLSGVMADAVAFCFDVVAQGTVIEGARLEIYEIEGLARCQTCGLEFEAETLFTPCPCGSIRSKPIRGEELIVKSMEMMEAA